LNPGDWTIEKIIEEKQQYDASLKFERKGDEEDVGWPSPAPSKPHQSLDFVRANILTLSPTSGHGRGNVFVSAADRSWSQVGISPPFEPGQTWENAHGSPVLSINAVNNLVFSTSMSGQLMIHDSRGHLLDKVRDHLKYAVQVVVGHTLNGKLIVATAGWDMKIHLYAPDVELAENFEPAAGPQDGEPYIKRLLREPITTIVVPTVPESMVLVQHPDTHNLYLIYSRRDSTFLHYYHIKPTSSESSSSRPSEITYSVLEAGRQNLAPHSNAWVAFTPSCLAPCPKDPTLLAIATSHLPHMKLIIVRLLFPKDSYTSSNSSREELRSQTQAAQARAALAIQDREDAAIKLQVTTMAPQTPYSTPQVVWRPGGHGVFVNADDGVIRGIDTQSGKVVSLLKGHEVGSKVRTLWCGWEGKEDLSAEKKELLVSGGFDKMVFFWRAES
jgi:WD40 repeat protein